MIEDKSIMAEQSYLSFVSEIRQKIQNKHLIADQSLTTLNITQIVHVQGPKLQMQFYYMPALAQKAQKVNENSNNIVKFNPFLNPDQNLLIKDLGQRHRLLFNKFNIYRNHLLVVTRQFQPQLTRISQGDMINSATIIHALDGILFFNGGIESGASQQHKHLQILPNQAKKLPIFSKIEHHVSLAVTNSSDQIIKFSDFNFLHGIIKLETKQNERRNLGIKLLQAYNILYHELIQKSQGKYIYYNMVACETFILIAIRKKQHAFGSISVNSLGFMGSLLFRDPEVMQQFKKNHSPQQILEDICQK